jgi:hypothetical protein
VSASACTKKEEPKKTDAPAAASQPKEPAPMPEKPQT